MNTSKMDQTQEQTCCAADTDYAPPQRASLAELDEQVARLASMECQRILDCIGALVFVLNEHRQIVFANRTALEDVLRVPLEAVIGQRPGEALDCVNAQRHEGGCGASRWCRDCGAVKAILTGLSLGGDSQECRITRMKGNHIEALDLLVKTETLELQGTRFLVLTLLDISHEKRRRALERIFFHDLMNLAGGLGNLVKEFSRNLNGDAGQVGAILERGFNQMLEEIQSQKILAEAENDELVCKLHSLDTCDVLHSVANVYQRHRVGRGKTITVAPDAWNGKMDSDEVVLARVLGNLAKNALEAVNKGETVIMGCDLRGERIVFWVHNPGAMTEEVQRQVFSRSFSTKGKGRGLGTYGVQLLTEACLGGEVRFTVQPDGIRFFVDLPAPAGLEE